MAHERAIPHRAKMYEFLDRIPGLTDQERQKLVMLGADSPLGLLYAIRAAPAEFEKYFGKDRIQSLAQHLDELVSPSEREAVESLPDFEYSLGARQDLPAPPLKKPNYDIEERDSLFKLINELRHSPDQSSESREMLKNLEQQLNSLLERG
jgi:hypothetical protein